MWRAHKGILAYPGGLLISEKDVYKRQGMGARAVEVLVRAVNENKPIDINADPTFEAVDAYLVTKD